jgi:hypothetical protein
MSPMEDLPPSPITARPAIYIDLDMPGGRKQVLDIGTARAMHQQLGLALASLDAAQEVSENDPQTALPLQDDPEPADGDDLPSVGDADLDLAV